MVSAGENATGCLYDLISHSFLHCKLAPSKANPIARIKFAPSPQFYLPIYPHQPIGYDLFGLTTGTDCIDPLKEAAQFDIIGRNF
jgi:hypothetical protein